VEAGRPANEVLPIDLAVRQIALQFLKDDPSRRLLILLLDGMAWAQAVEILESLGNRSAPWGPLAWHRAKKNRVGEGSYPAVFAALPTVTEVSRAAFFAGKPMKPGAATTTDKDRDRWLENKDLEPYHDVSNPPDLMLRAEGHSSDGSASPEALNRVANANRRIVALVINAIDAALKGDPQHDATFGTDDIRSLPDLLDKAREAGRAVLLASDHGHIRAGRWQPLGGVNSGGGARWRPWKQGEPTGPSELVFHGSGVTPPKGADGVVLLIDDESRYGGGAHAGEHGGATLAEVVAPCLLIGCADYPPGFADDPHLRPMPMHEPRWWHPAELLMEAPSLASAPKPEKPAPAPQPKQLKLTGIVPEREVTKAEPQPRTDPTTPAAESALARSELLLLRAKDATLRKQVIQAVEFLLSRNGVASGPTFATALGELPYRVYGLIAKLQEVVNVEGYQVLRFDPVSKQVHLDRDKLAQQFEVEL
jgi:hypothetical protein